MAHGLKFLAMAARRKYGQRVMGMRRSNLIAYWPLGDLSGSVATDASGNGRNGACTAIALGQAGIGDGRASALFDGSASYCNTFGAGLASAFSGQEGTLALWMRVANAGVWPDGTRRLAVLMADASNRVIVQKAASGDLIVTYIAGGITSERTVVGSGTSWMHVAVTWSKSSGASGEVRGFLNGAQVGATLTALGTFAGALSVSILGASNTTPTNPWSGRLAHVGLWSAALTTTEVARLVSGYPKA